jgi:hypothetical protein
MEVQPSLKEQNGHCPEDDKTRGRTKRHYIKKDYKGKEDHRYKRSFSPPPIKRPGNHMIITYPWQTGPQYAVKRLMQKQEITKICKDKPKVEEVFNEERKIRNDIDIEYQRDREYQQELENQQELISRVESVWNDLYISYDYYHTPVESIKPITAVPISTPLQDANEKLLESDPKSRGFSKRKYIHKDCKKKKKGKELEDRKVFKPFFISYRHDDVSSNSDMSDSDD